MTLKVPAEALPLYLENALWKILSSLPNDWPIAPIDVAVQRGQMTIRLTIRETEQDAALRIELSQCELAVFQIVAAEVARLNRRITGAEAWVAFRGAGHRWGRSCFNTALADLTASGHLVNDHDKRGYGMPAADTGSE